MRALPDRRLRSHLLTAPAASIADAAGHMTATQAQEFWGGRWALALRTRGEPTLRDVDAAFDRAEIVRSWTMRGTIHIVPARDLGWLLALTGERQRQGLAATHRREGIDAAELDRAERAALTALAGGGRLTRAELFAVLEGAGVPTSGQRGYHLLCGLSWRGVVCQGPVVPRAGGPTREQYIVRTDEWITDAAAPVEPLAELFTRYIGSHGPAGIRDFSWWSGLPLGVAREAAAAASDRVSVVPGEGEPVYVAAGPAPRRAPRMPEVLALPPFDEYYLSYADRTGACAPALLGRVGPGANGMVRPVLVARGEVVGAWSHSHAVGRHEGDPLPELFTEGAASAEQVDAALQRYRRFLLG
ncbi:winged helix DNA-binding domain-containing protein [Microbacterium sp. 1P10UB]|uniref:winged helix DNA-binding domain-containing protein n=1 Tax=unclassified Microbacterium TaxID=2609290 RepID=UPI0039A3B087